MHQGLTGIYKLTDNAFMGTLGILGGNTLVKDFFSVQNAILFAIVNL